MVVSRKTGHYRNAVLVPAANHCRQLIPTVRYPQFGAKIALNASHGHQHSAAALLTRRRFRLNHPGKREVLPASQSKAAPSLLFRKSASLHCLFVLQK